MAKKIVEAHEDNCVTAFEPLPSLEVSRAQGYIAAEQVYSIRQNPYPCGTLHHAWWEAGHSEATDDLCGRG